MNATTVNLQPEPPFMPGHEPDCVCNSCRQLKIEAITRRGQALENAEPSQPEAPSAEPTKEQERIIQLDLALEDAPIEQSTDGKGKSSSMIAAATLVKRAYHYLGLGNSKGATTEALTRDHARMGGGKIVLEGGRYITFDEEAIKMLIDEAAKAIKQVDALDYTDQELARNFASKVDGTVIEDRVWDEKRREWNGDEDAISLKVLSLLREEAKSLDPYRAVETRRMLESNNKARSVGSILRTLVSGKKADWDNDPFLLGIPEGRVVDLRTGTIRNAKPEDYITRYAAIVPADEEDCPEWKKFLARVQPDPEMRAYLKRQAGYFLTGYVKEEMFPVLYGEGGNGKGTYVQLTTSMMGTYHGVLPVAILNPSKYQEHPTSILKLKGLRLATISETPPGGWNETRLKSLTGADKLTGRGMRQNYEDFNSTHKIMIDTNNKPTLSRLDDAMKRRFHLVPFSERISPAERDTTLKTRLPLELSGILRWAINGCLEWQKGGLQPPKGVVEATEEYFSEQDLLGQWLDSHCERGDYKTTSKEYFRSWRVFARENGEDPGAQRALTEKLKVRGFTPCQVGVAHDSGLAGFRLKPTEQIRGEVDYTEHADQPSA